MAVQLTVIGLGQIGTSIGLALSGRSESVNRVGHDREIPVMNKAKALGAFDSTHINLPASVDKADIVLLCLPLDQVEATLKIIAPDLREDVVVMDVAPVKSAVAGWFKQYVPAGRHYVGLVPSVNPLMLLDSTRGIEAARADLFDRATIGIVAPQGTPSEAVTLAEDLVRLIGGQPLFLEMLEADGALAATHLLPQVVSAALLNATVGQPGWAEARRFAGRPFALAATALGDDTLTALERSLLLNPEATARSIDLAIGALTYLREAVTKGDEADLNRRLQLAFDDHEAWVKQRRSAEWQPSDADAQSPMLGTGNWMKRLLVGERPKKK